MFSMVVEAIEHVFGVVGGHRTRRRGRRGPEFVFRRLSKSRNTKSKLDEAVEGISKEGEEVWKHVFVEHLFQAANGRGYSVKGHHNL